MKGRKAAKGGRRRCPHARARLKEVPDPITGSRAAIAHIGLGLAPVRIPTAGPVWAGRLAASPSPERVRIVIVFVGTEQTKGIVVIQQRFLIKETLLLIVVIVVVIVVVVIIVIIVG